MATSSKTCGSGNNNEEKPNIKNSIHNPNGIELLEKAAHKFRIVM